jgi:hypothetical protein
MIAAMRRLGWLTCAVVAACDTPPGTPLDAADPPAGNGLRLEWHADVTVPSDVAPGCVLTRAELRVAELRVIGDAGSVDLASRELVWQATTPDAMNLASAPPGVYSRLRFELETEREEDDEFAYELRGTFTSGATTRPFVIRDHEEVAVSIPFSVVLPPGGEAAIPVAIALGAAVAAVDFAQVPVEDGVLLVEEGAQYEAARAALLAGFQLVER